MVTANRRWPQNKSWMHILLLLSMVLLVVHSDQAKAQSEGITPGLTLSIDSDTIYLGDSVVIEMEAVGILDIVDISSLFKDADLLRESSGTRIAVIQDRVMEVKLRRMEFIPRQEGQISFGPLQADSIDGEVTSNTVAVNVLPAITTQWQPDSDDLQISFTLSDTSGLSGSAAQQAPFTAYVGQHIIADISLKHKYPIADEQLTLPDFDGFDILPEYEMRRTVQIMEAAETDSGEDSASVTGEGTDRGANEGTGNDTDSGTDAELDSWRVIEWRYHLFAQRSGMQKIDGIVWRGLAIRSRTQRAEFVKQIPLQRLNIKPSAENVKWWLPASRLSLSDSWSKDPRELSAGDEVFRTITLTASDVLASHLPTIEPLESRAITSTAIEQTRDQTLSDGHIEATATFKFRLVAQSPIPVFLDTVRVPWYDPEESTLREAIIPARRINIGLPERADLLAELALDDQWLDTRLLELRSAASRFAFWHVSLAVLVLLAFTLLVRDIQLNIKQRRHYRTNKGRGTSALPGL